MKKQYSKPFLEVEVYQLNAALAAGCTTIVSMGPGTEDGRHKMCSEYEDSWEIMSITGDMSLMTVGGNTPFYDEKQYCDCYYTSGGTIFVTS